MRITIIQMNSNASKADNLEQAQQLITDAVKSDGSDLVALPELFACLAGDPQVLRDSAESFDDSATLDRFSKLARQLNIHLHVGSIVERDGEDFYNTTAVFDGNGQRIAKYRKIHRFDVTLPDGTEIFESKAVAGGEEIVTYRAGKTTVGCSTCYDVRFPELYRQLRNRGAELIMIPSAFTFQTGADHWALLVRARAVDTQCYVAAPAQVHSFDDGKYMNFGHTMIVDPWGQIVAQVSNKVGWATAVIDHDWLATVRSKIPIASHFVLE